MEMNRKKKSQNGLWEQFLKYKFGKFQWLNRDILVKFHHWSNVTIVSLKDKTF